MHTLKAKRIKKVVVDPEENPKNAHHKRHFPISFPVLTITSCPSQASCFRDGPSTTTGSWPTPATLPCATQTIAF